MTILETIDDRDAQIAVDESVQSTENYSHLRHVAGIVLEFAQRTLTFGPVPVNDPIRTVSEHFHTREFGGSDPHNSHYPWTDLRDVRG